MNEFKERIRTLYYIMKGECIFCKIIERNEKILYEDENSVVFAPLESSILSEGHLLVVPKEHHENIYEIPEESLGAVNKTVKEVANKLKEDGFDGVNILHASGESAQQSVNHFHIHLVPRKDEDERDMWPESEYVEDSYKETYHRIENLIN